MSITIEALNKIKKIRQEERPEMFNSEKKNITANNDGTIATIGLVIVASVSIFVNVKTITEFRKMRSAMAVSTNQRIEEQDTRLSPLYKAFEQENALNNKQKKQIADIENSLKDMKGNLKDLKSMATKIDDLKTNNKLLQEKLMSLSEKVRKISETNVVNH